MGDAMGDAIRARVSAMERAKEKYGDVPRDALVSAQKRFWDRAQGLRADIRALENELDKVSRELDDITTELYRRDGQ